ncbi:MAG: FkbM family methyltransferase [Blastochloris sp.]|nr:FkbM family methyltransferase [Blastochloris sp.]
MPVSTLEEESYITSLPEPRLLKLDVQGYEAQVLRGGGKTLALFQWILLETSTKPMYLGETLFEDLVALLKSQGFAFNTPVHIHLSETGAIGQFDAIFVKC